METLQQRRLRIARLEERRNARRAGGPVADIGTVWPTPDDAGAPISPVEIAPGRGDLNRMAGYWPSFPTALQMVGRTVSFARIYMSQPWVAAAVLWMLTKAIRVPLRTYQRQGDDPADRKALHPGEHMVATAMSNPSRGLAQYQLVMNMLGPVLVHGNSVHRIDLKPISETLELETKDWRFCRPVMPFRDSIDGWEFDYDQPRYKSEASADKVLHCRYWSPVGPIGCSPLQQLGISMQIEDAAQRFQRGLWANGARPPNALVASVEFLGLEPAERRAIMSQLREDVNHLYVGPDNAGRPMLLPPGLDAKAVGQTTVEAALIEQRKLAREEVCGVYLIPPPLLGILERATFSNIQVQRDMIYTDCLGPPLIMLEQCINAQLCRDLLQEPDIFVEFDFSAVLRGDPLQEIEALRNATSGAMMTPNEARSVLRLKKSGDPAMDQFYIPGNNMIPITDAAAPPTQDPELGPTPSPPAPTRGQARQREVITLYVPRSYRPKAEREEEKELVPA